MNSIKHRSTALDARARKLIQQARQLVNRPADARLSALAIPLFAKALQIEPNSLNLHAELAMLQHQQGLMDDARKTIHNAQKKWPLSIGLDLQECILEIPNCYRNAHDVLSSRDSYGLKLEKLLRKVRTTNNQRLAAATSQLRYAKPFYLPFQNYNDRELQAMYGEIICRIMAAAFPERAESKTVEWEPGARIRLGIVSAHVRRHSVWRVMLSSWLKNFESDVFEIHIYSISSLEDDQTELAKAQCSKFFGGGRSTADWRALIIQDRPHALLYPEVGMDSQALQLAAMRLSPIQCVSWGHSTTSGLPTIDNFISGQLIEPDDAEDHYTEKLVRLPGFSFHFEPESLDPDQLPREHFGLRANATVFFCAQALWKYLPEHDHVYPEIANKVDNCQFVFMQHKKLGVVTSIFRSRLEKAFAKHNLLVDDYAIFLPPLSQGAYQRLGAVSDIMLDSIGYGGWTTVLDSLSHDLPIITVTGNFMRGRLASAALQQMGLKEIVANDTAEYVQLAIKIGNDSALREALRAKIYSNKASVYQNNERFTGLQAFFKAEVATKVAVD